MTYNVIPKAVNPLGRGFTAAREFIVELIDGGLCVGYLALDGDEKPYWTKAGWKSAYRFDTDEAAHEAGRYMLERA